MSYTVRIAVMAIIGIQSMAGCVGSADDSAAGEASDAVGGSSYTATKYPIVLIPGIFGFEELIGVVEYFPEIPEALGTGGAKVYLVVPSAVNSSAVRAAQIIPELEEIKAITGAARLNLIGHSQGAVDARLIAATRPDLVASVTSIGGPHRGAPLADTLTGPIAPLGVPLVDGVADLWTLMSGSTNPNDAQASLAGLSTAGMAQFNALYPAALPATPCGEGAAKVGGIAYYSWGGVGSLTNPLDLLDPLWLLNSLASGGQNDGMVTRCSSHLGSVIRDNYPQNHIDETNMIFGLVMPLGPKPATQFRSHANRMRLAGL